MAKIYSTLRIECGGSPVEPTLPILVKTLYAPANDLRVHINTMVRINGVEYAEGDCLIPENGVVDIGAIRLVRSWGLDYGYSPTTIISVAHVEGSETTVTGDGLSILEIPENMYDMYGVSAPENGKIYAIQQTSGEVVPKLVEITSDLGEVFRFTVTLAPRMRVYARLHDTQPKMVESVSSNPLNFDPWITIPSNATNDEKQDNHLDGNLHTLLKDKFSSYIKDTYSFGVGGVASWKSNEIPDLMARDLKAIYPETFHVERTLTSDITEPLVSFFQQFVSEVPTTNPAISIGDRTRESWVSFTHSASDELRNVVSKNFLFDFLDVISPSDDDNLVRIFDSILYTVSDNKGTSNHVANIRYDRDDLTSPSGWVNIFPKIIRVKQWTALWWHDGTPIFGTEER